MTSQQQESEDVGMKVLRLEEKTSKLENTVSEMSHETRAVLSDVRNILTDLDNPLNYLKGLGIDEVILTMADNIVENKLKEFMEKRVDSLVKTIVDGKMKQAVNEIMAKFIDEQLGSIIELKVSELKDKGMLNVPIDMNALKAALGEKLGEALNSPEMQDDMQSRMKEYFKIELEERLEKEIKEKLEKQFKDSVKEELEEILKEGGVLQESMKLFRGSPPLPEGGTAPLLNQSSFAFQQPKNRGGTTPEATIKDNALLSTNEPTPVVGVSIVGLTACAAALMKIFGRKGAQNVIEDYYRKGWFSEEVKSALLNVVSVVNSKDIPEEQEVAISDHITIAYLFDKLKKGSSDLDFLVVLNLLKTSSSLMLKNSNYTENGNGNGDCNGNGNGSKMVKINGNKRNN
ncbi:MAG: hypothetical protein LUP94_02530 [Candidatus Methanomethylicus sp.]|nr:hypothetical protein [Candidatus Methanomethylicus sp.]